MKNTTLKNFNKFSENSSLKPQNNNKSQNKNLNYKSREQSGHFHVYIRGNNRFTVFYDSQDFIGFLKRCNAVAKKHNTKIAAFLILDNHIHLHVITDNLTPFVRALLIGFTQWQNRRKGFSDKLFRTPFSSSHIYSKALIAENLLYIFSNPIKAGICQNPWEYKWSSYHFHNITRKNPLEKLIEIDTSTVNAAFPNMSTLDKAISSFLPDVCKNRNSSWPRTPDYLVIKHFNTILAGRNLCDLTKTELEILMVRLRKEQYATYRQIASLTHESYVEVRKLFH
jgi:putative transposase